MVLLRVRATPSSRTAVLKEAEIFGARVADSSTEGCPRDDGRYLKKLDEFIDVMRSYGEIEASVGRGLRCRLKQETTPGPAGPSRM